MQKFNFDEQVNRLQSHHLLFKRLFLFMTALVLVLVIMLFKTLNTERIILVPQVAPEYKLWVGQAEVSNEYLATLSRNVLDLMLDITPNNVTAQHAEVLRLVAPKYTAQLKSKLDTIAKLIVTNNISQNFYISDIKIMHSKNFVYIAGDLNEYFDQSLNNTGNRIYKLSFTVNNYGVMLNNFEILESNDPQLKDMHL